MIARVAARPEGHGDSRLRGAPGADDEDFGGDQSKPGPLAAVLD